MSVREEIEARLGPSNAGRGEASHLSLPRSLKREPGGVRTAMLRRLSASRQFALGDRAGTLKAAARRSGRGFRLDVRQRVIVKALVSRHLGKGAVRGAALARHVAYLGRSGAGVEGSRPEFFDRGGNSFEAAAVTRGWAADRHHFRFIVSPEHGDRTADLPGYVREVMARVSADLGEPGLDWIATCHFDTDQPHAHVLVRGRLGNGRDLVIPRHYVGYGFRTRAQEVAQERLGDLSRLDAERRIWRETERDGFTTFDRRLLSAAAQSGGLVDDGIGGAGAWAALSRGRLRHLERLGLARPEGRQYRLAPDLEAQLRGLQMRKDIIRTLNQRQLEGAREVSAFSGERLQGEVVRSGYHDELGAIPFAVVRDAAGVEQYVRLGVGRALPEVGAQLKLLSGQSGAMQVRGDSGFEQSL